MNLFEFLNIEVPSDGNDPVFYRQYVSGSHSPYEVERYFFSLVQEGDVEGINRALASNGRQVRVGSVSDDGLRQMRYFAVAFITLGTRSAIEGGLSERDAYSISDLCLHRIDAENNAEAVLRECVTAIQDFTARVNEAKPRQAYSLAVKKCTTHIQENLHNKISLETLAELCDLSPVYLSSLFKKEVGINLSQYILHEKLERSKEMIVSGEYGFEEISNHLGFCSQSYYIRCFKREYGVTPREFKQMSER